MAEKPEAVKAGKKTYENSCQLCHGGDARGGRGPALATGNFQHGGEDWELYQSIRRGIPGTQMPAFELPNNEIWELVTYLRSLSGTASEEVVDGNVAIGARLFAEKGGCLTCHEVNGQGGRLGPDLSTVGNWTAKALREAILSPNQREGREPNTILVKTKDGHEIRGLRKNDDTFTLQLMDMAGNFHLLQKKDLVELKYEDKSLMPENYDKQFSPGNCKTWWLTEVVAGPGPGQGSGRATRRWTGVRSHPAICARTSQLAHLLWRLSRSSLLGPERDHSRQCERASNSLGFPGSRSWNSASDTTRRGRHPLYHRVLRLCRGN